MSSAWPAAIGSFPSPPAAFSERSEPPTGRAHRLPVATKSSAALALWPCLDYTEPTCSPRGPLLGRRPPASRLDRIAPAKATHGMRAHGIALALILAVCLAAFGAATRGEFVWDDKYIIVDNPGVPKNKNTPKPTC